MDKIKNFFSWIGFTVVCLVIGILLGYYLKKCPTLSATQSTTILTLDDSLRIAHVINMNGPGKLYEWIIDSAGILRYKSIDTIYYPRPYYVVHNDTIYPKLAVVLDTIMSSYSDTLHTKDTISIRYRFPFTNWWDINLKRDWAVHTKRILQIDTVTNTITIPFDPTNRTFWQRFDYGPTIGIGINGEFKPTFYLGIGIHYGFR